MALQPIYGTGNSGYQSPSAGFGQRPEDEESGIVVRGFNALADLLSRGTYASAAGASMLVDDEVQTFGQAMRIMGQEAMNPKMRLTYSKVLAKAFPEFAKNNPISTGILGFVGDVALDPLTYIGGSAMKVIGRGGKSAIVEGSKWRSFMKEYVGLSAAGKSVDDLVEVGLKYGVTDTASMRAFAEKTAEHSGKLRDSLLDESSKRLNTISTLAREQDASLSNRLARARYGAGYDELDNAGKADIDMLRDDVINNRLDDYGKADAPVSEPFSLRGEIERRDARNIAAGDKERRLADRSTQQPLPHTTPYLGESIVMERNPDFRRTTRLQSEGPVLRKVAKENDVKGAKVANIPAPVGADGFPAVADRLGVRARELSAAERKVVKEYGAARKNILEQFQTEQAKVAEKLQTHGLVDRHMKGLVTSRYQDHLKQVSTELFTRPTLQAAVTDEVDEAVSGKMVQALLANPGVRSAFEHKGTALLALHVPFTEIYWRGGQEIVEKAVKAVKEATPLGNISKRLEALDALAKDNKALYAAAYRKVRELGVASGSTVRAGLTTLRDWFDRGYDLPEEYIAATKEFQTASDNASRNLAPLLARLFSDGGKGINVLSAESRAKVGQALHDLDNLTGKAIKDGTYGTPGFVSAVNTLRANARLTPEEHGVMVRFQSAMHEIQRLESGVGLLEHEVVNYAPRYYELTAKAKEFLGARQHVVGGLALDHGPGEARLLADTELAKKLGLNVVTDVGAMYARRVLQSQHAFAQKSFADRLVGIFGDAAKADGKGSIALDREALVKAGYTRHQAQKLVDDLAFVGDGLYDRKNSELKNFVLKKYDGLLGLMKRSATVFNPAFAFKQAVGNTIQSSLVLPLRASTAAGYFDPRTYGDALSAMMGNLEKTGVIKTAFGETITSAQHLKDMVDNGIIRNQTMEGLPSGLNNLFGKSIMSGLKKFSAIGSRAEVLGKMGVEEKNALTMSRVFSGIANYMNWPGVVEDMSRATLFTNARRGGYSVAEAAKMVDDALFDYAHGMTEFEQRVVKRVVPFYSFQKFAYGLMYKTFTQKLGKGLAAGKGFEEFLHTVGKAFGGEELSEAERHAMPGWILEQPSAVRGFNEHMKLQVMTFNNWTPLDVLSFASIDETEDGEVRGVRRWLEKSVLAQLTPFIKVPVELLLKRNAFTGRQLENKYTGISEQKVGQVAPEDAMGAILASVAGAGGYGTVGAALGFASHLSGGTTAEAARAGLKKLLGWEERIDPETGKTVAYVNAYNMHTVSGMIPGLNHAMRPTKQQYTPMQRTMSALFGIHSFDVDLQKTRAQKLTNYEQELQRKEAKVKALAMRDSEDAYNEALADLQDFARQMQKESDMLLSGTVRGGFQ